MSNKIIKEPVIQGVAKVPVIMQMEDLECGAAALSMVLAYYEKWEPLELVRVNCGVSRNGSNARNIILAARQYGLQAEGFKVEIDSLRENGQFPCILHWEFNHFVVCKGFKGNKVYINDPAKGSIVISLEELEKSFTGVCILFEPTKDFEPSGRQRSILPFIMDRIDGVKRAMLVVVIITVVSTLLNLANSGFMRFFVDYMLTGKNNDILIPFVCALSGVTLLLLFTEAVKTLFMLRLNGKLSIVGSTSYMWHVLRLPMEFFSQRSVGEIIQRHKTNATIAQSIVNSLIPCFINSLMIIFYLVVMLRYSALVTCVGIAAVFINIILSRIIANKRMNIARVMLSDKGKLESVSVSSIEMIETIKASGAENGYFERWAGYQAAVNTQNERYEKQNFYLGSIPGVITELANASVLVLGVFLAMNGHFTAGMIMMMQTLLMSFTAPANSLLGVGEKFIEMRADIERLDDVMNYNTAVNDTYRSKGELNKLSGNISIKNVTFGYSKLEDPVIKNFSLDIKQGSKVAIVGASGCGKSTVSKLLTGLYTPWSGDILFEGKHFNEIDRDVFTGSVAVVDQDITIFEDTISNNIKMWDESIEDFEVILAARDAKIHDDIIQRPGGYGYVLNEGGKDLSGGQKQRLEIARVLAQDPTIVILDEATSALDAKTENEVVTAINQRGITCIVIAHRLSAIRDCDEIVVLDKGEIKEQGRHSELFAKGGIYAELVSNE